MDSVNLGGGGGPNLAAKSTTFHKGLGLGNGYLDLARITEPSGNELNNFLPNITKEDVCRNCFVLCKISIMLVDFPRSCSVGACWKTVAKCR